MKIKLYGKFDPYALHLGIQTTPEQLTEVAHARAKHWAVRQAKSYDLILLHHAGPTDITVVPEPTGVATAIVTFFTTLKEGAHPC